MENPQKNGGTYLDRLYACLGCDTYFDGKTWLTSEEAEKIGERIEGSNKKNRNVKLVI